MDYLARRLIDSGWSTKAMIREIVFVRTRTNDRRPHPPDQGRSIPRIVWCLIRIAAGFRPSRFGTAFCSSRGLSTSLRRGPSIPLFRSALRDGEQAGQCPSVGTAGRLMSSQHLHSGTTQLQRSAFAGVRLPRSRKERGPPRGDECPFAVAGDAQQPLRPRASEMCGENGKCGTKNPTRRRIEEMYESAVARRPTTERS